MNAPHPPAPVPLRTRASLFTSVRSSRDYALVAFAGAVLAAFALHAGAFLPRLDAPERSGGPATLAAPKPAVPAVVARRPPVVHGTSAAVVLQPCPDHRG